MFIILFLFTFTLLAQDQSIIILKKNDLSTKGQAFAKKVQKQLKLDLEKKYIHHHSQQDISNIALTNIETSNCLKSLKSMSTKTFLRAAEDCYKDHDLFQFENGSARLKKLKNNRSIKNKDQINQITSKAKINALKLNKNDEVNSIENPYFFEANNTESSNIELSGLDETVNKLAQFKELFIHLNQSKDINQLAKTTNDETLKLDLQRLIYSLNVKKNKEKCSNRISKLPPLEKEAILKKNIRSYKDLTQTDIISLYFKDSSPKNVEAFKIKHMEKVFFLFRDKHELSDSWLLSYTDENGELIYRKFKVFNTDRQEQIAQRDTNRSKHLSIFKMTDYHNKILKKQNKEVDLDINLALDIKLNKENIPLVGPRYIPTDDITIGSVGLQTKSEKYISNSSLDIHSDEVKLETHLLLLKKNKISIDSGIKYKTFDGKWKQYSRVKTQNFMVEYNTDIDSETNLGAEYYLKNSYIGYRTNFKNKKEFTAGTMFKNKKGGVHTSIEVNKSYNQNVTLFLILD